MKEVYSLFPDAYAIYDVGKYYGICVQESFYLVDKTNLEVVKAMPRYEKEVVDLIEKAIPIDFAED